MSTEEELQKRKDIVLNQSLKKTLKQEYPDKWKDIMKCIEDAIGADLVGEPLEDRIDTCLDTITGITFTDEQKAHLKKGPRSFITVGGG